MKKQKNTQQVPVPSYDIFAIVVEKSPNMIFINQNGRVIFANEKCEEIMGYKRKEFYSRDFDFMVLIHPESRDMVKDNFMRHMKGEEIEPCEYKLITKDARELTALQTTKLIDYEGKKAILGIITDITVRKQAEEELIKHHDHLEVLVRERTREIFDANRNLKNEISVRKRTEKKLLDYQKQLQLLSSQLSLIEENEKRRIASELHDCIGQTLALSKNKLGLLNKSTTSPEFKSSIKEILSLIEQTIRETRTLTFELSPPILYELGLIPAIRWLIDQFAQKHGLAIELIDDGQEVSFDNNTRFFIFQAIRELLLNVVKHAEASRVTIIMSRDDGSVRIVLEDDGTGFPDSTGHYNGYGLFNIRERMNHINGKFEIKSIPGRGTRVTLVAPLMPDHKLTKRSEV